MRQSDANIDERISHAKSRVASTLVAQPTAAKERKELKSVFDLFVNSPRFLRNDQSMFSGRIENFLFPFLWFQSKIVNCLMNDWAIRFVRAEKRIKQMIRYGSEESIMREKNLRPLRNEEWRKK